MDKKPTFTFSIDAQRIFEMLPSTVGQIVEYKAMSAAVGRDVQKGARGILCTAIRRAQRDKRMVFGVVRNVGVKLLSDVETVETGSQSLARIRHTARRMAKRMDQGIREFDKMPNEMKTKCLSYQSFSGMIAHISTDASVRRLSAGVEKAQGALPLAKTLEAFRD